MNDKGGVMVLLQDKGTLAFFFSELNLNILQIKLKLKLDCV